MGEQSLFMVVCAAECHDMSKFSPGDFSPCTVYQATLARSPKLAYTVTAMYMYMYMYKPRAIHYLRAAAILLGRLILTTTHQQRQLLYNFQYTCNYQQKAFPS